MQKRRIDSLKDWEDFVKEQCEDWTYQFNPETQSNFPFVLVFCQYEVDGWPEVAYETIRKEDCP